MDKEYYKDIEKIKTIGSTYMAAVGLVPTSGTKVRRFYISLMWRNRFPSISRGTSETQLILWDYL